MWRERDKSWRQVCGDTGDGSRQQVAGKLRAAACFATDSAHNSARPHARQPARGREGDPEGMINGKAAHSSEGENNYGFFSGGGGDYVTNIGKRNYLTTETQFGNDSRAASSSLNRGTNSTKMTTKL